MDFFDGLTFSMFGSVPEYAVMVRNEPRYYSIQFNYRGPLRLRIDRGDWFEADGPCAFLTFPGHWFEYGPPGGQTRHHNYICTCGPRVQRYIDGGLWEFDLSSPLIRVTHPDQFLRTMREIMTLAGKPGPVEPRAVLLFEELLLRLHEAKKEKEQHLPHQAEQLKALARRIAAAPERAWDFEAEARKCHVTLTHFRRIFKEITELPPQQFLLQMRLSKAAELLKSTPAPVKEIAALSGWENVFYFSRLFRQKYYISPLQYRKEFHV